MFLSISSSNYLSITTQFSCVALLGWRHKNKHIKCYRAREGEGRPGGGGGGGGGGETLYIGTYTSIHVHQ